MTVPGSTTSRPLRNIRKNQSISDWGALSSLKTASHWGRKAAVGARRSPQQGCGEFGSHLPMTTPGGGV
jgi:hypothetical protein